MFAECIYAVSMIYSTALQNQLVPLLGSLSDQDQSVYGLLRNLENKVRASQDFGFIEEHISNMKWS